MEAEHDGFPVRNLRTCGGWFLSFMRETSGSFKNTLPISNSLPLKNWPKALKGSPFSANFQNLLLLVSRVPANALSNIRKNNLEGYGLALGENILDAGLPVRQPHLEAFLEGFWIAWRNGFGRSPSTPKPHGNLSVPTPPKLRTFTPKKILTWPMAKL